jgi:hypothetical protein
MADMNDDSIFMASRYVDGDMSTEERNDFESLLQANAELRAYVAQYTAAQNALRIKLVPDTGLDNLKQTLGSLNHQYFNEEAKVVSLKPYIKWLGAVAAAMLLGLMVWAPWQKSLYEQYGTATSMSVTERGAGAQTDLEKAADFYNKKNFTIAEKLLAKVFTEKPENSLAAYYYAITLIENKQDAKARGILGKLYAGESAFKYDAAYYIALSYIKEKDKKNCRLWLEKIPPGTANYKKAKELEGKL